MLVTFRSTATESITMFSDVAQKLLKLMGATGRIPGALNPEDVPAALAKLESAIDDLRRQRHTQPPVPPADNEDWSADDDDPEKRQRDENKEPPVDITTRAVPLISVLKRAAAANAELSWEGKDR